MDTTITVKIESATKKAIESLAKETGLSFDGLVNAWLIQAIVSHRLDMHQPEQMTSKTEGILAKAEQELATGDFSEPFDSAKDAIAHLEKTGH